MKKEIVFTKEEMELLSENPYELLYEEWDNENNACFNGKFNSTKGNINRLKTTQEINKIIEEFAETLSKIAKKYPKVGIGDTATDEAIVEQVYSAIH